MRTCITVARKELHDHLRDIRSLGSTALYALMGPAVVGVVSLSPAASRPRGSYVLFSMASVFVLVAAFTRGMNVAIDVMAGERERRSLVPLLLNRPSWQEILVGKWIAVSIFAVGSLTLTLAGFALVLAKDAPESSAATAPQLFAWMSLGLIPLAFMGAATAGRHAVPLHQGGTVLADDGGLRADGRWHGDSVLSGMGRTAGG